MAPEMALSCRKTGRRAESRRMSSGMAPDTQLARRDNTWRLVRRPMVDDGMGPTSPTPGRCSLMTVELAASQVTPTHASSVDAPPEACAASPQGTPATPITRRRVRECRACHKVITAAKKKLTTTDGRQTGDSFEARRHCWGRS
ncbi:hypothetical protein ZWY2020_030122 [Hordeum vulgare]|nr:hypothetical protein ZWY2020_030122 [Hordeum vulgare]